MNETELNVVVADHFFITVYQSDDDNVTTYNPAIGLISSHSDDNTLVVTTIVTEDIDSAVKAALTIATLLAEGFSNPITIIQDDTETYVYEKSVTDFLYQGNVSFDHSKLVH